MSESVAEHMSLYRQLMTHCYVNRQQSSATAHLQVAADRAHASWFGVCFVMFTAVQKRLLHTRSAICTAPVAQSLQQQQQAVCFSANPSDNPLW
jgi:hypothetical protein